MKCMWHIFFLSALLNSCSDNKSGDENIRDDKETAGVDLWLDYRKDATGFSIWSPNAEEVKLYLYEKGNGGAPFKTYDLEVGSNGLWRISVGGDLHGTYYTYSIKYNGEWLKETPGIYARAVGVNGNRAMVIDLNQTNPSGWDKDKGPEINHINEAIIYELHIRDMTIQPESGSSEPGKYLGLVESGTKGPLGVATGIDHLSEMGVTHVHLLPTYDHYSIDETRLDSAQFNWGYDPNNYNVPEGSFSSDPYKAEVRIKEFKAMIKALHDRGIGVILDVVYNHTGGANENSNFNLEAPGYYYRHWEDGKLSDASACGNETASEKEMMRKFILESVVYWAREYHMDGFRFDLMGIHDIATMNEVATILKEVNPNIFVYGEGWTAADSPLPMEQRAVKKNIIKMPQITAFSDDIRDGLKGSVFEDESTGFVSGAKGTEESVKMGIVGCIEHPQIDYASVNYSDAAWTLEPWQSISYVSCHDNHTLYDKLKVSRKDASEKDIIQMDKLANAVVLTSQGTAFIHAGSEMLRTKNGNHNSYNLPDSINQIDWNLKVTNAEVLDYYKNLIKLRKLHPAFRMITSDELREKLKFKKVENGLISYQISDFANGDTWKNIYVIYNARRKAVKFDLPGEWEVAVFGDAFYFDQNKSVKEQVNVPALSMMILYQKDAAL